MDTATIRELQSMLRELSFLDNRLIPLVVDGVDGAQTQNAVRTFQRLYDLPPTGVADYATWEILREVYTASTQKTITPLLPFLHADFVVRPGETDDVVFLTAFILNSLAEHYPNFEPVTSSTYYNADIETAVRNVKTLHGLENNGEIDRQTWNLLAVLYNNRLASAKG